MCEAKWERGGDIWKKRLLNRWTIISFLLWWNWNHEAMNWAPRRFHYNSSSLTLRDNRFLRCSNGISKATPWSSRASRIEVGFRKHRSVDGFHFDEWRVCDIRRQLHALRSVIRRSWAWARLDDETMVTRGEVTTMTKDLRNLRFLQLQAEICLKRCFLDKMFWIKVAFWPRRVTQKFN